MKRYVAAMIRDAKTEEGLTEDNFKVVFLNEYEIIMFESYLSSCLHIFILHFGYI